MIISLCNEHIGFPPSTPKQAEEFMVLVANPLELRLSAANDCPVNNMEILKAVTNVGPLKFEGKS